MRPPFAPAGAYDASSYLAGMRTRPQKSKGQSTPWTAKDDERLASLVEKIGKDDWCLVSSIMQDRSSRQCRERYNNHVDPTINKGP